MTTTRTANRINQLQAAYTHCTSPYLFNKLQQAKKSLKRQKQKAIGTQTKINLSC